MRGHAKFLGFEKWRGQGFQGSVSEGCYKEPSFVIND